MYIIKNSFNLSVELNTHKEREKGLNNLSVVFGKNTFKDISQHSHVFQH